MRKALLGIIILVGVCAYIEPSWAQETKPAVAAELPGSLVQLAEAAGLTPEEVVGVATALSEFETGRRAAEARVSEADVAWREATAKDPVDEDALGKANAAVKAAKEDRKRYHEEKAVDLAKLMPAEKYTLWVATDLQRAAVKSLSGESIKLDAAQTTALADLCKALATQQIAKGEAGTKAARKALLAEVRDKILTAEQRGASGPTPATEPATTAASQPAQP